MTRLATTFLFMALAGWPALADEATVPPAWFLEEINTLSAGTGRWVADNSGYKSEDEPYDSYVTEWVAGFAGSTLRGRLFGIADGVESGDFWEFRLFWHPAQRRVVMQQFGGGGTFGTGTMWRVDDRNKMKQTFFGVDGSSRLVGHISYFRDARAQVTDSFDIDGDVWTPRRSYTWYLEGAARP